jgi:ABC-type amino acid transport substrate-binding protein
MSLSTKVLIGLGLGIAAGIFFGETAAFLKVLGNVFILLLQMTVLPYVMAYGIARGDRDLLDFVNIWIDLKKKDQTIQALYDYWILGRSAGAR